jgi:protein-S-isoprenylcysteine O-methyltransferase
MSTARSTSIPSEGSEAPRTKRASVNKSNPLLQSINDHSDRSDHSASQHGDNRHVDNEDMASDSFSDTDSDVPSIHASNYPNGKMSLAGIALRAMLLGVSFALTSTLAFYLSMNGARLWRVPFFIASLSVFHFLEFYVTAKYNTRYATVSAFLLSSNGWAYNVAHGSAAFECFVWHYVYPDGTWLGPWSSMRDGISPFLYLGFGLLIMGQVVRTIAMATAASNFNHHVQSQHQEGHVLVKSGLYGYLRHPSYFGFFWWGLGTQLILGNVVCFFGYAFVLWRFFSSRIKRELYAFWRLDVLLIRGGRRGSLLNFLLWRRVCPVQKDYCCGNPGYLSELEPETCIYGLVCVHKIRAILTFMELNQSIRDRVYGIDMITPGGRVAWL